MFADATLRLEQPRVRINVTCEGILLTLSEHGAIVRLPTAQTPNRQTTLAMTGHDGDTLHLAARIVRSVPRAGLTSPRPAHDVAMEFLELPRESAVAIRQIIDSSYRLASGQAAQRMTA